MKCRLSQVFFWLASIVLLTQCMDGTLTAPSGSFTHVYENTLRPACMECHNPTGAASALNNASLDLTSRSTALTTLFYGASGDSSSYCQGIPLVVAGAPSSSYIMAVLFSDYAISGFGGRTNCIPYSEHHQSQNLSSTERESLITWIQNGALDD